MELPGVICWPFHWPVGPEQLLHRVVYALQKRDSAEVVSDYRPVTIFPLPYRCWSSIRGRSAI